MTGPVRTRRSITAFVLAGLGAALVLAFVVSHFASSAPDGLERVAIDQGFADTATEHGTGGSPLADYGVSGVQNGWLSTGLAGVIGVLLCFALAAGLVVAIRWSRRRSAGSSRPPAPSSPAPSSPAPSSQTPSSPSQPDARG